MHLDIIDGHTRVIADLNLQIGEVLGPLPAHFGFLWRQALIRPRLMGGSFLPGLGALPTAFAVFVNHDRR